MKKVILTLLLLFSTVIFSINFEKIFDETIKNLKTQKLKNYDINYSDNYIFINKEDGFIEIENTWKITISMLYNLNIIHKGYLLIEDFSILSPLLEEEIAYAILFQEKDSSFSYNHYHIDIYLAENKSIIIITIEKEDIY